jgi:hypothetical protein
MMKNKREKNQRFSPCNFFIKNRRAWIRVVEAFVAILLITGAITLLITKNKMNNEEMRLQIHDKITPVLRDIENNKPMREAILDADLTTPVEWEEFESQGLLQIRNKITEKTPRGFECQGKLCALDEVCLISDPEKTEIYAESAFISADLDTYAPRQLKIFCWRK